MSEMPERWGAGGRGGRLSNKTGCCNGPYIRLNTFRHLITVHKDCFARMWPLKHDATATHGRRNQSMLVVRSPMKE